VVLGALALLALREKKEMNKVLTRKNIEVIRQRNEIKKMAKKADKATEAKFMFFTNISHEFRTPLTLILGPVEDVLMSDLSVDIKKDLILVKKNATRLLHLVNQLMDFRKVENLMMKLRASEIDIDLFVREIASSFDRLAHKKKIEFKIKSKLNGTIVFFEADKLDKVLFNLLSNAFKYTDDGGEIVIELGLSDQFDQVVLKVKDNGKGMTPEQVEHAFDRFYTGEASNHLSTGLGLALSKEFIQMHHGEISVVSEKWKGTLFVISLPLGRNHLKEDEVISDSKGKTNPTLHHLFNLDQEEYIENIILEAEAVKQKEHTLLIIEDNTELRNFLKKRLVKEFNIVEAPDGILGMDRAFASVPDLIICDVMLPNVNGLKVTSTLKKDLRTSHIPIILLTAKDSIDQKIEGVQVGADLYVTKPFSFNYLNERIKGLIKSREMLSTHYSTEIKMSTKATAAPKKLDKKFVNDFTAAVELKLSDPDLNANKLAAALGLSRVQLYRKVKALLGYSVNDYVVDVRLRRAQHLMIHSEMNISEIAYEVGFASPAYFSTAFKNSFKVTPSEYKSANVNG
jgi:DNA-binding response OmpR family regulator/nitrogen-specific signal transduction histidine kinase